MSTNPTSYSDPPPMEPIRPGAVLASWAVNAGTISGPPLDPHPTAPINLLAGFANPVQLSLPPDAPDTSAVESVLGFNAAAPSGPPTSISMTDGSVSLLGFANPVDMTGPPSTVPLPTIDLGQAAGTNPVDFSDEPGSLTSSATDDSTASNQTSSRDNRAGFNPTDQAGPPSSAPSAGPSSRESSRPKKAPKPL
jgi:hypothetical protein